MVIEVPPPGDDRAVEAVATAAAGALLAAMAGRTIGSARLGAVVGAVSGAVAGWRGIYDWKSRRGVAAFVLDHTWGLVTTAAGTAALALNRLGDAGYEASLSERQNRMVHRRGFVLRRGFAVTFGYVVNGAEGRDGTLSERRRKLVTHHEDVHVWQARWWGPMYPIAYLAWTAGGGVVAVVHRLLGRSASLAETTDELSYYRNPFEWHAYSRDDNWPPSGVNPTRVWSRPFPAIGERWATKKETRSARR